MGKHNGIHNLHKKTEKAKLKTRKKDLFIFVSLFLVFLSTLGTILTSKP